MCEPDKWVRTFSIDETALHKNGFTIYKITSVLFPLASPEAVTIVSVWKRYSDLQKLHRKIKNLHSGLYLKGKIPEFSKWSYFKRFDSEVVEDRKRSIKLLLEFVAEYPPLFTSTEFVNFLKSGYPDPSEQNHSNIEAIRSSLQLPVEEPVALGYPSDEEDTCSSYSKSVSVDDTTSLGCTLKNNNLNHLEETKQTSKSGETMNNVCDDPFHDYLRTNSLNPTKKSVLKQTSVQSYDSLSSLESASSCILPYEEIMNMDVNKMSPYNVYMNTSKTLPDLLSFDKPSSSRRQSDLTGQARNLERHQIDISTNETRDLNVIKKDVSNVEKIDVQIESISSRRKSDDLTRESRNLERLKRDICSNMNGLKSDSSSESSLKSEDEIDYGSMNRSLLKAVKEFGKKKDSLREFKALFLDEYSPAAKFESTSQYSTMPSDYSTSRFSRNSKKYEVNSSTDCSYVFEAAQMLNLGARCEDSQNFKKAFDCYKAGIEKMLIGVQDDTDDVRRQFVKEKTTKYLSYAELLYREHLVNSDGLIFTENTPPKCSTSHIDKNESAENYTNGVPVSMLKRPYEDLAKYRVLGIVGGKAMLVLYSEDQQCYVMKVVQKIPQNVTIDLDDFYPRPNDTKFPTLPTNVPYMVQLKCYMETNNLIFLIIDYASGGKLFDYINNYVKSVPNTPAKRVNLENVIVEPAHMKIYSGNDVKKEICNSEVSIAVEVNENTDIIKCNVYDMVDRVDVTKSNRQTTQKVNKSKGKTEYESGNRLVGISISDVTNRNLEMDISVTDIVLNSQRLLLDVDDTLNGSRLDCDRNEEYGDEQYDTEVVGYENRSESSALYDYECNNDIYSYRQIFLPPSSLQKWSAELLTAVEYLHNSGVICRDLNPSNLLLAKRGHLTLTYFIGYDGLDVTLSLLAANNNLTKSNIYVAPEIYSGAHVIWNGEFGDNSLDKICDFWSYGAILYELITGVPLKAFHPNGFNSHTILQFPEGLDVEIESLLTQLLTFEPKERLGSGPTGIEEIKVHPYFKNIDWKIIYESWISPD